MGPSVHLEYVGQAAIGYGRWARNTAPRRIDAVLIAIVVGISILLCREAGNTATLNDDPVPLVSPNDVLCPVTTYLCLSRLQIEHPGTQLAAYSYIAYAVVPRGERGHNL